MKDNDIIRDQIFEIVENQIKANDPPETKLTYDRLIEEGYDHIQTKKMIGACVTVELYEVIKSGKPYNNDRYIKNLLYLPKEPHE